MPKNLLEADLSGLVTRREVFCSTRPNPLSLLRAIFVVGVPVSTINEALTRLTSTSTTRCFGSLLCAFWLSRFSCLSFTTPKPSCFKRLYSVELSAAVSFGVGFASETAAAGAGDGLVGSVGAGDEAATVGVNTVSSANTTSTMAAITDAFESDLFLFNWTKQSDPAALLIVVDHLRRRSATADSPGTEFASFKSRIRRTRRGELRAHFL